jgi:2-dehydro-3-deoxyphosphogluconate aldolase/(4S)-4-hydroxy-2-oxoglutarate aldolase
VEFTIGEAGAMTSEDVRLRIQQTGVVPAVRAASYEDAAYAAAAVCEAGIPIVEMTMTVPGALELISDLVRTRPELIVGAGTVFDVETARRCLDAGVKFLTSPGLDADIVELAFQEGVLVFPGVLTPTEIQAAQKAGCRIVKVFPCSQVGGPSYIRAMQGPFPRMSMIAAGGVTQANAAEFIRSGAVALGIGEDLIPRKAVRMRETHWIQELARRFTSLVKDARAEGDIGN